MLTHLAVRNLATLQEIQAEFQSGLNILTGSTGAGKSIILGSLSLILGEKADSQIVRTGTETASVEATFHLSQESELASSLGSLEIPLEDQTLVLRREVSAKGTSKAFANDRSVTLATLKQIGSYLVDLHGQHQHQSLLDTRQHLEFLDRWGNLLSQRARLKQLHSELAAKERELHQAREESKSVQEKKELYQFQLSELDRARLQPGEDQQLIREKSVLENVEKLAEKVSLTLAALQENQGSAVENLSLASNLIRQAASWDVGLKNAQARLEEGLLNLKELSRELESYRSRLEYDPARLEFVRERLSLINSLKKRYGLEVELLLSLQQRLRNQLEATESANLQIDQLESELNQLREAFRQAVLELSTKRKLCAAKLTQEILRHLQELGLEKTRFQISFSRQEDQTSWLELENIKTGFDDSGFDRVEFLISPNPGEELRSLAKIVSGGELSRIMLALKSALAQKDRIPVLVFDEIDSGIGGEIAEAVGRKLKTLSKSHQILCITHLQQIASFADAHFKVEKTVEQNRTSTSLTLLDPKARVEEISRLISGQKITSLAQKQASLMIQQAARV